MSNEPTDTEARALDRTSPVPLWSQVHDDLVRRVQAGAFSTGFPGELQLTEEYAVSRHTVREALRRLRDAGVVDAARGRPSVVASRSIEQPLGSLYSLFRAVESRGLVQRSDVLRREEVVDPDVAVRLGVEPDTPLFHLARLRFANEEPLARDRVWLPAAIAHPLLDVDFAHCALYDELASRCDVRLDGGRERITAVAPTRAIRQLLALPANVGCLAIERIGTLRGRPLEYRLTDVRGDRYAVTMEWSGRGYRVGMTDKDSR